MEIASLPPPPRTFGASRFPNKVANKPLLSGKLRKLRALGPPPQLWDGGNGKKTVFRKYTERVPPPPFGAPPTLAQKILQRHPGHFSPQGKTPAPLISNRVTPPPEGNVVGPAASIPPTVPPRSSTAKAPLRIWEKSPPFFCGGSFPPPPDVRAPFCSHFLGGPRWWGGPVGEGTGPPGVPPPPAAGTQKNKKLLEIGGRKKFDGSKIKMPVYVFFLEERLLL